MRTVSAPFERYDQVTAAVEGLSDMGVACDDISIRPSCRQTRSGLRGAIVLGSAIGGAGGILGAAVTASVLDESWLAYMLLGLVFGGLLGGTMNLLKSAGAGGHAGSLQRGSILVVARVHDDEAGEALSVLRRYRAIDTNARRSESADGWDGFAAKDIWDEDIGSEDEHPAAEHSRRVA